MYNLQTKLSTLWDIPSRQGLVLSMPLNNGFSSGALIYDESESGYTGTATNSPVFKYPGMDFTAASSMFIDIGAGSASVKTISLWVNQDDVAGNEYPIDLNGTDYIAVESGVVTVYGLVGHSLYVNGYTATSGVTTIAAVWSHIALTDATANNASDLDIGRVTAAYFDGLIADVLLYSRVLTSDQILSLYMTQKHKYKTW